MKRKILHDLKKWKISRYRKPLILKGARQIGKTFSLKLFGSLEFNNFVYLNFEKNLELHQIFEKNLEPQRIIREIQFLYPNLKELTDLIIFDEIQACPKALNSLKYFFEEMPHVFICAAGSLLGVHLSSEAFPVGCVDFFNMEPMSFEEFLLALNEKLLFGLLKNYIYGESLPEIAHQKLWDFLKIYFVVGGLPEAVKTFIHHKEQPDVFKLVRKTQENLLLSYHSDMAKHSGKTNSMHIERLLQNVPAQLARELDGSANRFVFKDLGPGLSRFTQAIGPLDWLEKAGLIVKVPIVNQGLLPFAAFTQENFFKLFMFDVGMLGCLAGLTPESLLKQDYGTYKGYFAENFVAQELRYSGRKSLYSWRENTAELEFLIEINSQVIPIEVKSGKVTKSQSLRVFLEKYKLKKGIILSAKPCNVGAHRRVDLFPLYLAARIMG